MRGKALAFLTQNKDKPFFLYYALTLPHLALQAPPDAVAEYVGQFEEMPYLGNNGYCPAKYPRATYAAMVTYLDTQVGILRTWLRDQGLDKNTVVIFTSDNGSAFEIGGTDPDFFKTNGPHRGHKGSLYEGGIRVPMIAAWPGTIKPGISSRMAAQYDLLATAEELAGLKSEPTDGISLVPEFTGRKTREHPFLYFELAEYTGQQAVRMGKWKAIRRNLIRDKGSKWELFDLSEPGESVNVADQFPEILKQMVDIARKQHQPGSIPVWNFME